MDPALGSGANGMDVEGSKGRDPEAVVDWPKPSGLTAIGGFCEKLVPPLECGFGCGDTGVVTVVASTEAVTAGRSRDCEVAGVRSPD